MASGVSVWALRELDKGLSVTAGFGVKHRVIALFVPWFPWGGIQGCVVGRDPALKILHVKILQGATEERPEEKKVRTAQTAGWDGKGANERDSGDGLLLIGVPMLWDVRGTVSLGRVCWGAPLPLPVLWVQLFVFQEWREKVPCGNRQLLHVGSYSVSPMYDGNIREACVLWGSCWHVLLSCFCYRQRAAVSEGTLSCLIWPPAPWLGQIYLNFPSRCLSKAVVKSLQWWTSLILPGWFLKVGHCSCHYWDFPSLSLWFLCSSWELLPSCPFVTVQSELFSPLGLPLGISGLCLPWAAGSKTCLECCVWYLRVLSQQTPFCDSQADFWSVMNAF